MFNTRKLLVQGCTAQDWEQSTFRALSDFLSEFSESDESSNPEPRTSTPRTTLRKYKRAQRALGPSPEEKVKGHSGANNREPQGHNLNNFGKGPFDDVIY